MIISPINQFQCQCDKEIHDDLEAVEGIPWFGPFSYDTGLSKTWVCFIGSLIVRVSWNTILYPDLWTFSCSPFFNDEVIKSFQPFICGALRTHNSESESYAKMTAVKEVHDKLKDCLWYVPDQFKKER